MFPLHYKDTKFEAQSQVFGGIFSQFFLKYLPCRVPDTNEKVPTAVGLSGQEKYLVKSIFANLA